MSSQEAHQLSEIIKEEYRKLDDREREAIKIGTLAEIVYRRIDPRTISPLLVQAAALLELKQLARSVCRERQQHDENDAENGNLFDFQLQPRYPAERDGEDAYVLREFLTWEERKQNVTRLRHEGHAKLAHADALEAETDHLVREGKLQAKA
jgi:gamma-glutamylcyclotransferase (GGCT)/AIG2-like uncharacterized protein YtfP